MPWTRTIFQYLSWDMVTSETGDKSPQSLTRISNTLTYQLYEHAIADEQNPSLLESCNKVFSNPKQEKVGRLLSNKKMEQELPNMAEALRQLSVHLGTNIVVAIDAVDHMSSTDQVDFFKSLEALVAFSDSEQVTSPKIQVVISCRSNAAFSDSAFAKGIDLLDIGDRNREDINLKLTAELERVVGLTQRERRSATPNLGRSRYVVQVAIPFIQQPFQRPLSKRLDSLPKGISDAYNQFVRGLSPSYLELLRTALQWTLFAPSAVRIVEIMEAVSGVYSIPNSEQSIVTDEKTSDGDVRIASQLEVQQLRTATGPFLDLWEDDRGQWWSSLKDPSQARQFCIRKTEQADITVHSHAATCAKCNAEVESTKALSFTERRLHLEMALTTVRHLNNFNFRKQFGLFPDWMLHEIESTKIMATAAKDDSTMPEANEDLKDESSDLSSSTTAVVEDSAAAAGISANVENAEPGADAAEALTNNDQRDNAENATSELQDCHDCGASDDSQDDDDREADYYASAADDGEAIDFEDVWQQQTATNFRYEANCWYYHLREAEALWTPEERLESQMWSELFGELDKLVGDDLFFTKWQQLLWLREMSIPLASLPWKALHIAAFLGLPSWATHLIAQGHDTNERCMAHTPLRATALKAQSVEMLKLLLENGADPNTGGEVDTTALQQWAGKSSSSEAIKLFIEHRAKVNTPDGQGLTALHFFAFIGQDSDIDVLRLLLNKRNPENQADINARTTSRNTPVQFLLGRREVPSKLLKAFIEEGADVNAEDSESQRPLQNASIWGDIDVVKMLLLHVSNINDPDRHGRTALHEAAWAQNSELIELLIDNKADPNLPDFHDRTPLFFACLADPGGRGGDSRHTIKLLIETLHQKGYSFQDVNKITKRGRTPLRQAAARGFADIVEDLLHMVKSSSDCDFPAVVNLADKRKGRTALHCAARGGHTDCVRMLLEYGADASLKDSNPTTPSTALALCYEQWALSNKSRFEETILLLCERTPTEAAADKELPGIAAVNGSKRVLEKLRRLEVDLDQPDQYGWTPIMLAKRFHCTEVEAYLKEQIARHSNLPTQWLDPDRATELSEDGRTIRHTSDKRICISSDRPLPGTLDKYYFEITSAKMEDVEQPRNPVVAIGLCTLGAYGLEFPGWPARSRAPLTKSWAYHGDDGGLFNGEGNHDFEFEVPYKSGDTVGCGVDLESCTVWFTKNGVKLDRTFEGVRGRLFPVLGLKDNILIETNFGTDPAKKFQWKDG